ncbi:MAG: hypothetical protein Q9167_001941 [Letrouitia subvulpina]
MTRKELPAEAINIKLAVRSSTTCTSSTAESLKLILLPQPAPSNSQKSSLTTNALPTPSRGSDKATNASCGRRRKRVDVTIAEETKKPAASYSVQARVKLATEIFNVVLESLSEAKDIAPVRRCQLESEPGSDQSIRNSPLSERSESIPLQTICTNQVSLNSKKSRPKTRPSSSLALRKPSGIRAQVECAQVALSALRHFQPQNVRSQNSPELQLEHGMSALVGKLIALQLYDLAAKELRLLFKRLDSVVEHIVLEKKAPTKQAPEKGSLGNLLETKLEVRSGSRLGLTITSQLQALKIIAAMNDVSAIEVALDHMQLNKPFSLANLIRIQHDQSDHLSQTKIASQLQLLARTILSTCTNNRITSAIEVDQQKLIRPDAIFRIQLLALEVRSLWWRLTSHQGDLCKEILKPFARHITNVLHELNKVSRDQYLLAQASFSNILAQFNGLPTASSQSPNQDMGMIDIYLSLAEIAQACDEFDEASQWLQRVAHATATFGLTDAQKCGKLCQAATVYFHKQGIFTEFPADILDKISQTLKDSISVESCQLEELLIRVSNVQRRALSIIRSAEKHEPTKFERSLRNLCLLSIDFLNMYISANPYQEADESTKSRYYKRISVAHRVAPYFTEAIILLVRHSLLHNTDWGCLDEGLRKCLKVALVIESSEQDNRPVYVAGDGRFNVFVSLSQCYWSCYLHLKRERLGCEEAQSFLQKSIESVENRPNADQVAALLSTKLEQYGAIFESACDYDKAAELYRKAIQIQINHGILRNVAAAIARKPLSQAFAENVDQMLLGRMLQAYTKVLSKSFPKRWDFHHVFDDSRQSSGERGALLEQQLVAVTAILQAKGPNNYLKTVVKYLAKTLDGLYTTASYPVRRLRAACQLMRLKLIHHEVIDTVFTDGCLENPEDEPVSVLPSSDTELELFRPHLLALRNMYRAVQETSALLKQSLLDSSFSFWFRLIRHTLDGEGHSTRIYDFTDWFCHLESLADYLDAIGFDFHRLAVLHLLVEASEAASPEQYPTIVLRLSSLGQQYVKLGYPDHACHILHKAQRLREKAEIPVDISLKWYLAYAEYALEIGNENKSQECLLQARELFENCLAVGTQASNSHRKTLLDIVTDVGLIYSRLAMANGQPSYALLSARQSVRSSHRAYIMIEQQLKMHNKVKAAEKLEKEVEGLAISLSSMSMSESVGSEARQEAPRATPPSPLFTTTSRLFRSFMNLSQLYAYQGLFSEARAYAEESQRLAQRYNAASLLGRSYSSLGDLYMRCGDCQRGDTTLKFATDNFSGIRSDQYSALLQTYIAYSRLAREDFDSAEHAFAVAQKIVEELLTPKFVEKLLGNDYTLENINHQMSSMRLEDAISTVDLSMRPAKRIIPPKNAAVARVIQTEDRSGSNTGTTSLSQLRRTKYSILRQHALLLIRAGKLDEAKGISRETSGYTTKFQDLVSQKELGAYLSLRQGLEAMVHDPVFCILPESTIAFPSSTQADRQQPNRIGKVAKAERHREDVKSQSLRASKKGKNTSPNIVEVLRNVQETIGSVYLGARASHPTPKLHSMMDVFARAQILLSALTVQQPVRTCSTFILYVTELARSVSIAKEKLSIEIERRVSAQQDPIKWPGVGSCGERELSLDGFELDFVGFRQHYVDIIPKSWQVISLSVNDTRDELRVARIRSGEAPFILSLPFNRHASRDPDEDTFGFAQAKSELQEIIGLANFSTHNDQDLSVKGAKAAWWSARAALDTRLEDLLVNLETFWLGGFRGILSQGMPNPSLLARFQESLRRTLDKYLPSRQHSRKIPAQPRVELDPRVLGLFAALEIPSDPTDADESLTDLLYFVIDVLQFNGERNAYDEIDFDSMTVEVLDALRQYHDAERGEFVQAEIQHTILILDKSLHCFPWESLPCMRGHAVTRLPSLLSLRERILVQREQKGKMSEISNGEGIFVDSRNGAYVLNPANDLTATQAAFEEPLKKLSGWDGMTQSAPGEEQFKKYLEDRSVFLYFGHGSGGQYIRSRTIKKLERCAVALLMGCSSGLVTEAGEFEPYGTPMNYMQAGCPAVLATLWNVTDKDIDRFSQDTLEKWGLFNDSKTPSSVSPVKKPAKQRGRGKKEESKREKGRIGLSLDQAVVQARESCIFKYLNGAAPVIYGVPVFLS